MIKSLSLLAVVTIFSVLVASATQAASLPYNYPINNPYLATITGVTNMYFKNYSKFKVVPRPERSKVKGFEGANVLKLGLFEQKNKRAPLVFVLAGTGVGAVSINAMYVAGSLYKMGFHVVTLPNPISVDYVVAVSKSGTPGYLPSDAKEYYKFMQFVAKQIDARTDLKISSYSVVGVSLGGALAGFIAKEDSNERYFNFERVVLTNPAMDLSYGTKMLDSFTYEGNKIQKERKSFLKRFFYLLGFKKILGEKSKSIQNSVSKQRITDNEMKWIIGESFTRRLGKFLAASKAISGKGIKGSASFSAYTNQVLIPAVMASQGISAEQAIRNGSLNSQLDFLAKNRDIYVLDNADDFIKRPNEQRALKAAVQSRMTIYPNGGHCGNYADKRFQSDLFKALN